MPDYAKSDGITTVEAHVQHLQDEREGMLPFRSFVMRKYLERTGRDLNKMLHRSIVWHDEGKRDPKWQYHCRTNTLRNVHVRHELISLVAMHKQGVEASSPVPCVPQCAERKSRTQSIVDRQGGEGSFHVYSGFRKHLP